MIRLLSLAVLASISAPAAAQQVWVDVLHGSDTTGTGAKSAPFATIGKGVATLATVSGPTTLHVEPGTYGPSTGETFPIVLPPEMTVQGAGAPRTRVSGEGNAGTVLFTLAPDVVLSDLTIARADVGIQSASGAFSKNVRVVRRCVVRDCDVGMHCFDASHADFGTVVVNSVFTGNGVGIEAESTGYDFQSVSVLLYGTTVTQNTTALLAHGVLERYLGLYDSIVYGNGSDAITGWSAIHPGITGNVLGDPTYVGTGGNVGVDPKLVDAASGDWHLPFTSPVVDLPAPPAAWPPAPAWVGASYWKWEPTYEEIEDLDGDERVGVATDPGADERVEPTLYTFGRTRIGKTFHLRVGSRLNEAVPVFASAGLLTVPVGGSFWLAPPVVPVATLVTDADGLADLPVTLPHVPTWVGLDAYVQGFRAAGGGAIEGTHPQWLRLQP